MKVVPFVGHHDHRLDPKDRVVIPAEFAAVIRDSMGGVLYLVPSAGRPCLEAYPEWRYMELAEGNVPDWFDEGDARKTLRFFQHAKRVELKGPGRITIPQRFLAYFPAGVVRVAGSNKHLELWDPDAFDDQLSDEQVFPLPKPKKKK